MRKMICLLLVLALCMSLTCTVFAAVSSPGQDGSAPTNPDDNVPATGDHAPVGMWLLVMLLALVALVIMIVYYYKEMKR